jgi:predicted nucleic-acid-binding protein
MRITADTNVLVRALTEEQAEQSKAIQVALDMAQRRYALTNSITAAANASGASCGRL